jgi:hypothetical protein
MNYNPRDDLYEDELNKNIDRNSIKDDDDLIKSQRETLKNNALFNLDFDEYKKQIYAEMAEQQKKLSTLDYTRDLGEIKQKDSNVFLFIGITLIIISIIIVIINSF